MGSRSQPAANPTRSRSRGGCAGIHEAVRRDALALTREVRPGIRCTGTHLTLRACVGPLGLFTVWRAAPQRVRFSGLVGRAARHRPRLFVWQFGLRAPRLGLISWSASQTACCWSGLWSPPVLCRRVTDGPSSAAVTASRSRWRVAHPQRFDDRADADAAGCLSGQRWPVSAHGPVSTDPVPIDVPDGSRQRRPDDVFPLHCRDVRSIVTPSYAPDLIFVPAGVLAAVPTTLATEVFWLFRRPDAAVRVISTASACNAIPCAERGPLTPVRSSPARRGAPYRRARRAHSGRDPLIVSLRGVVSGACRSRAAAAGFPRA